MTDPKLREARIAEAKRRVMAMPNRIRSIDDDFAHHICDLIEQDWRPEPEVDAVTLAAREWAKRAKVYRADEVADSGGMDRDTFADAFRAGHADGRANCADVRRMDWLERANFIQATSEGGGYLAACFGIELRTTIDRAMEGGQ